MRWPIESHAGAGRRSGIPLALVALLAGLLVGHAIASGASGAPLALVLATVVAAGFVIAVLARELGARRDDESARARALSLLGTLRASEVMDTELRPLGPDEPLERAVDFARAGYVHDFPVTEGGRLVGVLTRSDLLLAFANLGRQAAVADAMLRRFPTVEATESVGVALARLATAGSTSIPVVRGRTLVGLLGLESVAGLLATPTEDGAREPEPRKQRVS